MALCINRQKCLFHQSQRISGVLVAQTLLSASFAKIQKCFYLKGGEKTFTRCLSSFGSVAEVYMDTMTISISAIA